MHNYFQCCGFLNYTDLKLSNYWKINEEYPESCCNYTLKGKYCGRNIMNLHNNVIIVVTNINMLRHA